ncbi:UTP--glucose-1-phosphate uridylyltransferase GalU [Dictyoglomus thermophilum]|uniref:UTP--glucose-1-phosphate uridylyltransferase n=1 Tax=Dictyoglomus thermophilum (strain ATCC 35947 / DSM 3960 / H-6-12) TaxID=309799 RepID=B5YA64_DICT6|nr:UTP--glucose-1-phosphate uridylyltransferase GalU [Dictyoglomus thermophilum]ACI19461.1 UTP-glucose-1-phosphate uridylyltransferase [Dictyoglomus thermophilum H-6-12]MCX7720385.1 UTP--glucose-1-phosphate uridylyltransferase GalU [Dictyoglomus thermophilum]
MSINKAVFPAAGLGTRFLPATKAQPKEMLPVVDKPIIQYAVEEAVNSGIDEIIIVTGRNKRAIEDHFDISFELEYFLQKKGELDLLRQVREISELATVYYIRQKEPLGLGHAVLVTKELVKNEPFAVILSDDLIVSDVPCMKQMIEIYERYKCSVIAVERVPKDEVKNYGVIAGKKIDEGIYQVTDLVEKPSVDEAPSDLAIVGRYILTPEIFPMLEKVKPGRGGEIQLTDGLKMLLEKEAIYAYEFKGKRYDTGSKLGFLIASVELALKREGLGEQFKEYLKTLNLD